jgi:hypothetical protein
MYCLQTPLRFAQSAPRTCMWLPKEPRFGGAFFNGFQADHENLGWVIEARGVSDQIDLAARGAAWGDAVGVALANHLGPLYGQATNFLEDAAQGTAVYSASLASQPTHSPFQGEVSSTVLTTNDPTVELVGVAMHSDGV